MCFRMNVAQVEIEQKWTSYRNYVCRVLPKAIADKRCENGMVIECVSLDHVEVEEFP